MLALITATRNSEATLPESIASTSPLQGAVSHIFVDGHSTDGTWEILKEHARNHANVVLARQSGSGLYEALNQGLGLALADHAITHIALLHSDDLLQPDEFEAYWKHVQDRQCDIAYSDIQFHDASKTVVRVWRAGPYSKRKLCTGWMPPHTGMIVAKTVYETTGCFDPDFGTAADYHWIVSALLAKDWDIDYFHETTVSMRVGGASNESVRARLAANRMDGAVWKSRSMILPVLIRILKPLRKAHQFVTWKNSR